MPAQPRDLTVAVTGPTGDIGRSVIRALERAPRVARVVGMARRPFDPAGHGWRRTEYRRGDVLDRASVAELVEGADVVVHLAFIIFGGREETRAVNLRGSRNVFEAAVAAGVRRLVYTSSVAAYGFHADNPDLLTEEIPPRGTREFYYSAQKAELEALLRDTLAGSRTDPYVFRPCIVAGRDAPTLIEGFTGQTILGPRIRTLWRALDRAPVVGPVLPDPGIPFQLVHHDDVARAVRAAVVGGGPAGLKAAAVAAERGHEVLAGQLEQKYLTPDAKLDEQDAAKRLFLLQVIQPGLLGLMDGSVSTLAPLFAAAIKAIHGGGSIVALLEA